MYRCWLYIYDFSIKILELFSRCNIFCLSFYSKFYNNFEIEKGERRSHCRQCRIPVLSFSFFHFQSFFGNNITFVEQIFFVQELPLCLRIMFRNVFNCFINTIKMALHSCCWLYFVLTNFVFSLVCFVKHTSYVFLYKVLNQDMVIHLDG